MAYVTFAQPTSALKAYESLDKNSFQGRLLHILPAAERKDRSQVEENETKKRTFKSENHAKKKANAGREFTWAMLYMNVRAVHTCHFPS